MDSGYGKRRGIGAGCRRRWLYSQKDNKRSVLDSADIRTIIWNSLSDAKFSIKTIYTYILYYIDLYICISGSGKRRWRIWISFLYFRSFCQLIRGFVSMENSYFIFIVAIWFLAFLPFLYSKSLLGLFPGATLQICVYIWHFFPILFYLP